MRFVSFGNTFLTFFLFRASISIPHRTQFGASSGSNRMNTDSEEALIPSFNSSVVTSATNEPINDAMDQLQQLTLMHQMIQPPPSSSLSSTLIKPKPRTGITGYSHLQLLKKLLK